MTWQEQAACLGMDPDLFFPQLGEDVRPALAVCAECPVRDECLQDAIARYEWHGIWGGTTGRQRRTMREKAMHGCRWCGKRFTKLTNSSRYCSQRCADEGRKRAQKAWAVRNG